MCRRSTLLVVVSLALCLALSALWGRSYRTTDVFRRVWPKQLFRLVSTNGRAIAIVQTVSGFEIEPASWSHYTCPTCRFDERCVHRPASFSFAGFSFEQSGVQGKGIADRVLVVPYWPVAVLFMVAPLVTARRIGLRRRRITFRLCPSCGYDLRATPGRCPECGLIR